MDSQPPHHCFQDAYWARKNGRMTLEAYIDLIVSHFHGKRHADDSQLNEASVKETARRDLIGAAAKMCMADSSFSPSTTLLAGMILACCEETNTSIVNLKDLGDGTDAILASPVAVQLLVAFSIYMKNKKLAKALINTEQVPPPGSQAIFGPPDYGCQSGHSAIQEQQDNACDVWLQLLNAGWVTYDSRMFEWATSSHYSEDAVALASALVDRGLRPERRIAERALSSGQWGMVAFALEHYKPMNSADKHVLLKSAAVRHPPEEAIAAFELLFTLGMTDINWMDTDTHIEYILNNWPLGDPRGICEMSYSWSPEQSILHAAVMGGHLDTIQWLISQGAKSQHDGWGRNPHDAARFQGRTEAMELLSRLGFKGTPHMSQDQLWDPNNTVQQAMERRREGIAGEKENCCVIF